MKNEFPIFSFSQYLFSYILHPDGSHENGAKECIVYISARAFQRIFTCKIWFRYSRAPSFSFPFNFHRARFLEAADASAAGPFRPALRRPCRRPSRPPRTRALRTGLSARTLEGACCQAANDCLIYVKYAKQPLSLSSLSLCVSVYFLCVAKV